MLERPNHATVCGLTATPQKMQNRSAGSGYAPHCGQRKTHSTSCTPQCMQNWSPAATARRQLGHCFVDSACLCHGSGGGSGGGVDGALIADKNWSAEANLFSSRA